MKKTLLSILLIFAVTCPNISKASNKIKASCPDNAPLLDEDGYCRSCYDAEVFKLIFSQDLMLCVTPEGKPIRERISFGETKLVICPHDKPLKGDEGCYSCDYGGVLLATQDCNICDGINNSPKRISENGVCKLQDCGNRPLKDISGGCYHCDEKEEIQVSPGACTQMCPNRKVGGTMTMNGVSMEDCYLPKDYSSNHCPAEKPVMDSYGSCFSCDYLASIKSVKGCDKCPNRETKGVWIDNNDSGSFCDIKKVARPRPRESHLDIKSDH